MSSSDYDQIIVQKYSLAVAIAVLKTKPQDMSIEEHIFNLRTQYNEPIDFDDDITICESDFDIDESDAANENNDNDNDDNDSVTILKNFEFNSFENKSKFTDDTLINVMKELNNIDKDLVDQKEKNQNDSQSTHFEGSQKSQLDLIDSILNEINNEIVMEQVTISDEKTEQSTKNALTDPEIDSEQTELYTLQDFIECNTHISQSQDNFLVSKNFILNNAKSDEIVPNNNEIVDLGKNTNDNETNNGFNEDIDNINKANLNINGDRKSKLTNKQNLNSKRVKLDILSSKIKPNDDFATQFSTQSTLSSLNNISQNTIFDLSLNCDSVKTNSTVNTNSQSKHPNIQITQESASDRINLENLTYQGRSSDREIKNNTTKAIDVLHKANSFSLDEFEYNTQSQNFSSNNSRINQYDKDNIDDKSKNNKAISDGREVKVDDFVEDASDQIKKLTAIDNKCNGSSDEVSDLTESQVEMISFKNLEELSKVKSYLNRKERSINSDSGYRSFQPRCSGESASQCSSLWINESAHCLMNFLTTCPIVISTVGITDEISKVLGKLIDTLHEDEIYPNFLEDMLEICNRLLNTIYEGRNYGENILNKDETIHRFLNLNRSLHIIKYSIEKITIILEMTLESLNEFEIQQTDKCENICYIFYILEDLLKRYNRRKTMLSQNSSQTSQDDRTLKRSSLSEIWRKKWNLTKNDVCEGALEKKCSLTKCSDVLNKIIVQAMEGYSLISFAALQCFNLLQN